MGHGGFNGTSNPDAHPPVPRYLKGQIYQLLTDWVEKGMAPENPVLKSATDSEMIGSLPMCAYPKKATYVTGDVFAEESYVCR
jgi:feruloyl esterase